MNYYAGPAIKADFETDDIIDEGINFFRANILFKYYDIKGAADRNIIYLTVFIQKCLEIIAKKYIVILIYFSIVLMKVMPERT